MEYQISVLNSVAAAGADCSVSNGWVTITGLDPFRRDGITDVRKKEFVAQTLQVTLVTPTAANNTDYSLTIRANRLSDSSIYTVTIPYTSDSSGSAAEVSAFYIDAINRLTDLSVEASATGANFNLTAKTPFAQFTATSNGTGVLTVATTTPGVAGAGLGSYEKAYGQYPSDDLVDANEYTKYFIYVTDDRLTGEGSINSPNQKFLVLYVNENDADYADLCGPTGTLTLALA